MLEGRFHAICVSYEPFSVLMLNENEMKLGLILFQSGIQVTFVVPAGIIQSCHIRFRLYFCKYIRLVFAKRYVTSHENAS
jgi:hypothetical protein